MKKRSLLDFIHLLLGANIILWLNAANYEFIGRSIPSAIKLGLVVIWFGIAILKKGKFLSKFAVIGYVLVLFYILLLLSKIAGTDQYFLDFGMSILYTVIIISVFCYYFYYGEKSDIKFLLIIFALDVAVVTIRTLIMLQEQPDLVRILSTSGRHQQETLGEIPEGVGGYGLCYELVLLQPALSYALNKKNVNVFLKILIYGLIFVFLFQAQITLALVMYPVVLIWTYSYGKKKSQSAKMTKVVLALLVVILLFALPTVLEKMIEVSEAHLAARLQELKDLFATQETGDDLQARLVRYQKSLEAFAGNPFWGGFGDAVYGHHSTLLDMLGAFGLLGLLGYLGVFRPMGAAKRYMTRESGDEQKVIGTTRIVAVIISVVNVLLEPAMLITMMVITPLTTKYFLEEKEKYLENYPNQCDA